MPQNVQGINGINQVQVSYEYELPEGDDAENMIVEKPKGDNTDENAYLDTDFESMSLEDVTSAAQELEIELTTLKMEIDNLEAMISANKEIKQNYEERCEAVKKQIEQAQKDLNKAETPQDKEQIKNRISELKQNVQSLTSEIKKMIGTIQAYNEMKSDARGNYNDVNYSYQKASFARSSKEMAQRAEASSSGSAAPTNTVSTGRTQANNANVPKGASSGKSSDNMVNALKNWEGLRTTAYQCPSGVWTIGYGHTGNVSPGQTISESQAEQYLRDDLASFENQVSSMAQSAGVKLTQGQFDALTSFAYNCGGGALQKSGILEMLKNGNIDAAASKMKEYVHGGGQVLPGLVSRRETEASWLYA